MEIIPIGEYILIKLEEYEEVTKTAGGILLAQAEQRPPKTVVHSFGSNVPENSLSVGDVVSLRPHVGIPIEDGKFKYKFVILDDITSKIIE